MKQSFFLGDRRHDDSFRESCQKKKSSYVAAAYVKWIEAAGGRAVPIRFYVSDGELRRLFDSVNGLIFPGE